MDAEETFTSDNVVLDTTIDSGVTDMSTDDQIVPEESNETTTPSKSRFPYWYALTVFSAISLIAFMTETDVAAWQAEDKWILSMTVISLILSCLSCVANIIFHSKFAASPAEGTLLFTELGLWVGGLAVMLETANGIAVNDEGVIINANLYFSSWGSFIATIVLFADFWKEAGICDKRQAVPRVSLWLGIGVSSLVAMASASKIFQSGASIQGRSFECSAGSDFETSYCERLSFAIALGVIGAVGSVVFCLVAARISSDAFHVAGSMIMLVIWSIGIALLTFGKNSPANGVGSLFFSCWAAFVFSLFSASKSLQDFVNTSDRVPIRIATRKNDSTDKDINTDKATGRIKKDEKETSSGKEQSQELAPTSNVEVPSSDV